MVSLPRNGPQRSGYSAGTVFGFTPLSFPPRKRGPRSRGVAAATVRTSAQWAFRWHCIQGAFTASGQGSTARALSCRPKALVASLSNSTNRTVRMLWRSSAMASTVFTASSAASVRG